MLARTREDEDHLRSEPVIPPSSGSACPLRCGDCPHGAVLSHLPGKRGYLSHPLGTAPPRWPSLLPTTGGPGFVGRRWFSPTRTANSVEQIVVVATSQSVAVEQLTDPVARCGDRNGLALGVEIVRAGAVLKE